MVILDPVDLCLWEVKIVVLKRKIAGTGVSAKGRCPLTDGVRKSSEGSTMKTTELQRNLKKY